jgi:tRNA threonylcarbamoyladenosine biosynthesis protein TsaE
MSRAAMEVRVLEILSESHEQTRQAGRQLSFGLQAGDVVALTGELGSGKTVFIQGVCAGLGVEDPVTSPTFTLIQEYKGRLPVFHFDFYRLETIKEIGDLDLPDYLQAGGVCLIEWAERGLPFYPSALFMVTLSRVFENGNLLPERRRIRIQIPENRDSRCIAQ